MNLDDLLPRAPGDPLDLLVRQDLARLSVGEIEARIRALEGEIARCRAGIEAAVNHRASSERIFRR